MNALEEEIRRNLARIEVELERARCQEICLKVAQETFLIGEFDGSRAAFECYTKIKNFQVAAHGRE